MYAKKKHKGSISSMFYQFLHAQSPESTKQTDNLTVFFVVSGSACVKATGTEIDTRNLGD